MSHAPALATSVKSPNPFRPVRPWVRGSTHRLQIAGHWLGGGISPRNSGEPSAGFHRVPSNSPPSAGAGWCRPGHVAAGIGGHMDSRTARIVGESDDPSARRVIQRRAEAEMFVPKKR
jgi:hypothetical protein